MNFSQNGIAIESEKINVGTVVPSLLQMISSMQANRRFSIFRKIGKAVFCEKSQSVHTPAVLAIHHFHNSKCHFLKWKSAVTAALSAQKRNGRTLSMAAKPFILTIDGGRLFFYPLKRTVLRRITMRAPFQILAIPYRIIDASLRYCVFHRADHDQWQFIAGGGEDNETPLDAAKRETFEEGGIRSDKWIELKSLAYLPITIISEKRRQHWNKDMYVIPEYTFGFECKHDIALSHEHTECVWLSYDEANQKLKWDSNRTALYELNCRLKETN